MMYAKNQYGEYEPIGKLESTADTFSPDCLSKEVERIKDALRDFSLSLSVFSAEISKTLKALKLRRKDLSDERKRASAKRYRNRKAEKRRKKAKGKKHE